MTLLQQLDTLFSVALSKVGAPEGSPAIVRTAGRPEFGDYQVNGIMPVAKKMEVPPRQLAQQVIDCLTSEPLIEKTEIAGPGFINITLSNDWLVSTISDLSGDNTSVEKTDNPQTIVVDYSHPNVAKEMAVHHIRSTVIGDAIVRILSFLGHNVIRQNHIGDWGTQFGMLIAHLEEVESSNYRASGSALSDLEKFYREAKKRFDNDKEFADKARQYVVKLQSGDDWSLSMWKKLVDTTMKQNQLLYDRLNITLKPSDIMGESAYNDFLVNIIKDLKAQCLLQENDGAKVVFLEEFTNKNGDPMGVIIQKSDGGYLYTTTDLAAINYRVKNLNANRIIYCVDARQGQHLEQVFTIARKAGFISKNVALEHYAFGMMMGKNGKPFKTRSGDTVKLADLLDEAEIRVANLLAEKNSSLTEEQKVEVINALAIGSIKYADLSKSRTSNYVFDWDLMLSFDGNTAPYMLYAYTRIHSIFKKGKTRINDANGKVILSNIQERTLALKLLQFGDAINNTAKEGEPHLLCAYLFELSGHFMSFYEHCPVNKKDINSELKASRLKLCALTANILKVGLNLLGIQTIEQM